MGVERENRQGRSGELTVRKIREIVEPEGAPYTAGPVNAPVKKKGGPTIIRAPKCKRLHFEAVWVFLGTLAAGGLALGGVALFIAATSQ